MLSNYHKHTLWILCCTALSLQSCFKSEPLNVECDIEQAYVSLADPSSMFFQLSDTLVNVPSDRTTITFDVRMSADLTNVAPQFVLTPGATIEPANGSAHDFSAGPVTYTVTSENKEYQRTYTVSFKPYLQHTSEVVNYSFEDYELDPSSEKYYIWLSYNSQGEEVHLWATANPGFQLARGSAKPDEYPTVPCEGINGMGVLMETRSTGAFGEMVKRPLAAGNFFIGEFDIAKALTETMKATRFGFPFSMKPLKFSGYYKYFPGPVFTDSDGQVEEGVQDAGTIYCVFYRNHDDAGNAIVLFGNTVQTSPYVVGLGRLDIRTKVDDWTKFEIEINYTEEIDYELLDNNGYSMAIVCSSSQDGDVYRGAIGSQLYVDEFKIECERIED